MSTPPLTASTRLTRPIKASASLTASPSLKCRLAGLLEAPATSKAASSLASTKRRLPSFDHVVGAGKQRRRDRKTDLLGGFEIDRQHETAPRLGRAGPKH